MTIGNFNFQLKLTLSINSERKKQLVIIGQTSVSHFQKMIAIARKLFTQFTLFYNKQPFKDKGSVRVQHDANFNLNCK